MEKTKEKTIEQSGDPKSSSMEGVWVGLWRERFKEKVS